MFRPRTFLAPIALVLAGSMLAGSRGEAHKPITSPYTYNEDVFPIVRDRCGRCHVADGVAPMSLLTYKEAVPWGESIRTELVAGHMPPWTVESGSATFKNAQHLTARELNVLLTWATGGTPLGQPEHAPAAPAPGNGWRLGTPDLVLPLPSEGALAADTQEDTQEFTLSTATKEERWIRAVDLLPGTPAIVRSASVALKSPPPRKAESGSTEPENLLALWLPGEDVIPFDEGAGLRLPAGAQLTVRVRYKKTWGYERKAMTDRSTVGVYFAPSGSIVVRALELAPAGVAGGVDREISFSRSLDEDRRVLAVYPGPAFANARVHVRATRPDGSHVELIRFRPQPDWVRRYWFARPVALSRGTRIEVVAATDETAVLAPPGATPIVPKPLNPSSVRLTLDVVAER